MGQALTDEGMSVAAKEFGFTESHQLAINVTNFGVAKDIARTLSDKNNIITNYNMLPPETGTQKPIRIKDWYTGNDVIRYAGKRDMGELAALTKAELEGKLVKDEVLRLRNRFTDIHFS